MEGWQDGVHSIRLELKQYATTISDLETPQMKRHDKTINQARPPSTIAPTAAGTKLEPSTTLKAILT